MLPWTRNLYLCLSPQWDADPSTFAHKSWIKCISLKDRPHWSDYEHFMLVVSDGDYYERVALVDLWTWVSIESAKGFVPADLERELTDEERSISANRKWQPLFNIETIQLGWSDSVAYFLAKTLRENSLHTWSKLHTIHSFPSVRNVHSHAWRPQKEKGCARPIRTCNLLAPAQAKRSSLQKEASQPGSSANTILSFCTLLWWCYRHCCDLYTAFVCLWRRWNIL